MDVGTLSPAELIWMIFGTEIDCSVEYHIRYFLSRKNVRFPWDNISNLTQTKTRAVASKY